MNSWAQLIQRVLAIGDRDGDTDTERLRHRILIALALLMSIGGLTWGSIASYFGLYAAAVFPYGYGVITAFNLAYFRATKDFSTARTTQICISLLLPFLFQYSLGGFTKSGAVMLWALFALGGSLSLGSSRQARTWLGIFSVMTILSGFLDGWARANFGAEPTQEQSALFFVLNITFISAAVFGLMIYLVEQREQAHGRLTQANKVISRLNDGLEDEVRLRTREVEEAFARFRTILDNMVDGLFAVGANGEIEAHNRAVVELFEIGQESLLRRRAHGLLPEEVAQLADACMEERSIKRLDIALPRQRVAACLASPVIDADGELNGAVVIVRDVTAERQIDRMKTEFIATVSHELRTPLTSVLGFTKITRNRLEEHVLPLVESDDRRVQRAVKQVRGNLDIILAEGERLTSLISDVLDISKLEAGKMDWKRDEVDPAHLLERASTATSSLFDGTNVALQVDVAQGLPTLLGDPDRLLQVFINLVSNARKFTDSGSVTLRAEARDGGVIFSVIDTGIGIDPDNRVAVFEKFKQVGDTLTDRPSGTGLGLPICREIVHAHGGEIWLESKLGEGATFRFTIPEHDPTAAISGSKIERPHDA